MRRVTVGMAAILLGALTFEKAAGDDKGAAPVSSRTPLDIVSLRERPLFSPDRTAPIPRVEPPAPPPPAPEPPAPVQAVEVLPPDWTLIGMVKSDRVNRAMFRVAADGTSFELSPGEDRDGWTLADIGRFDVLLQNGAERLRVTFPKKEGETPSLFDAPAPERESIRPFEQPMDPVKPQLPDTMAPVSAQ